MAEVHQRKDLSHTDLLTLAPDLHPSEVFKVNFDLPTPRPHYIIRPNGSPDQEGMTDLRGYDLAELCRIAGETVKLQGEDSAQAILAIHRGSWFDPWIFHVHVCVDAKPYLAVFEQYKEFIPNLSQFVSRKWLSKHPDKYPQNVLDYPNKGRKFIQKELQAIENRKTGQPQASPIHDRYGDFQLVFHPEVARLGFRWHSTPGTLSMAQQVALLRAMEEFALEHGLSGVGLRGDNNGCHLCVSLTGAFRDFDTPDVHGYIQLTASRFLQFLPESRCKEWMERFRSTNLYTLT